MNLDDNLDINNFEVKTAFNFVRLYIQYDCDFSFDNTERNPYIYALDSIYEKIQIKQQNNMKNEDDKQKKRNRNIEEDELKREDIVMKKIG
jgi:hypothetical protein